MFRIYKNVIISVLILAAATLSGCGSCGGGGSSTSAVSEDSSSALTLIGNVSEPSLNETSSSSSALRAKSKALIADVSASVTEVPAAGELCTVYTFDGDKIVEATTDADGVFTGEIDYLLLKPDDATGNEWTAYLAMVCDDRIESVNAVTVIEGETTEVILDDIDFLSTLAARAFTGKLAGFTRWGDGVKRLVQEKGIDVDCFVQSEKASWENAELSDSESVGQNYALMKTVLQAAMAQDLEGSGTTAWTEVIGKVLDGTADDDGTWDDVIAKAAELDESVEALGTSYDDIVEAQQALSATLFENFKTDGMGLTALSTGETDAASASPCEQLKAGQIEVASIVKPMLVAPDVASFDETFGDGNMMATLFGLAQQCKEEGCSGLKDNAEAFFSFLASYKGENGAVIDAFRPETASFDGNVLKGILSGVGKCEGDTVEVRQNCAKGLFGTVYNSGQDNWDQFMNDGGTLDTEKVQTWSSYWSGQAASGFEGEAVTDAETFFGHVVEQVEAVVESATEDEEEVEAFTSCVDELALQGKYSEIESCFAGEDVPDFNEFSGISDTPRTSGTGTTGSGSGTSGTSGTSSTGTTSGTTSGTSTTSTTGSGSTTTSGTSGTGTTSGTSSGTSGTGSTGSTSGTGTTSGTTSGTSTTGTTGSTTTSGTSSSGTTSGTSSTGTTSGTSGTGTLGGGTVGGTIGTGTTGGTTSGTGTTSGPGGRR